MKEDIFIKMLRFGKLKIEEGGFTYYELIKHLQENGYKDLTENNAIVKAFFLKVFFSPGNQEIHHSAFYQITPEAYVQLLDYDNAQQSRKASKQANTLAIIAIVLTLIATVAPLFF